MSTHKPRSSPLIQIWSPKRTQNPNVKDVNFDQFTTDSNGNILTDEGYIFFKNGHGAHIRRHYRYVNQNRTLSHYTAQIVQILPAGGIVPLRVDANGQRRITDDYRYHIETNKMPNPHMYQDSARYILPINHFLRQVQLRKPHKRSPARTQFVTAAQNNRIERGLPKTMTKPEQFKLDI